MYWPVANHSKACGMNGARSGSRATVLTLRPSNCSEALTYPSGANPGVPPMTAFWVILNCKSLLLASD